MRKLPADIKEWLIALPIAVVALIVLYFAMWGIVALVMGVK